MLYLTVSVGVGNHAFSMMTITLDAVPKMHLGRPAGRERESIILQVMALPFS